MNIKFLINEIDKGSDDFNINIFYFKYVNDLEDENDNLRTEIKNLKTEINNPSAELSKCQDIIEMRGIKCI